MKHLNRVLTWVTLAMFCYCNGIVHASAAEFQSFKNISYYSSPISKDQKLDIYIPKNVREQDMLPVHIYVHGGAWTKGDKKLKPSQVQSYTDEGVILVSLNYRLGPRHKYPGNIIDIVQASKWLRNNIHNYGGDKSRLVLSGHSAGAHLVALMGVGTPDAHTFPSGKTFKAIFSIDTASYDLTRPSKGKMSRFVNKQKMKVFGNNNYTLRKASPIHQIESRANYSPLHLYVTSSRPDAVLHTKEFERALAKAGQPVKSTVMKRQFSYSDMGDAIFDPSSNIFQAILSTLNN